MAAVFGLAALVGTYLVFTAGWPALLVGLGAILAALPYSVGRYALSIISLGDLFALLFFGFGVVGGKVYVLTNAVSPLAWLAALPVGTLVTAILVVNNVRDTESDRFAGRKNIAVVFGRRAGEVEYALLLGIAYLSPFAMLLAGETPWALLTWLSLPVALQLFRRLRATPTGKVFNSLLAQIARLTLL